MRIAVDCDLRRIHAMTDGGTVVCKSAPDLHALCHQLVFNSPDLVLFEVASPTAYRDGKAAHQNLAKWMLFNAAQAALLYQFLRSRCPGTAMLVSPSSEWTCGHKREVRHKVCKADASTKDLRECQAMLYFYRHSPTKWMTFDQWLDGL